jgi:hypothetical protein
MKRKQIFSAMYFVDESVKDDFGSGTATDPKKYFMSGAELLCSGDTLIIVET